MGVPCFHDLFNRLKDGGKVLPEDIHQFWWYDREMISTTLENRVLRAIVLDPAVVKGKGRPKGSKGKKKKGSGASGMVNSFKASYITVLILHFLTILGTCREPSQFEFTSTDPDVLGSTQLAPAVRTAVDNFMDSLSTTQLGFQRTFGVKDTCVPGTVPERLHKRVARTLDSGESDGAFVSTPDVFVPTLEEEAAAQAEVDDDALTKAIEFVKSIVSTRKWQASVDGKRRWKIRQRSWRRRQCPE